MTDRVDTSMQAEKVPCACGTINPAPGISKTLAQLTARDDTVLPLRQHSKRVIAARQSFFPHGE